MRDGRPTHSRSIRPISWCSLYGEGTTQDPGLRTADVTSSRPQDAPRTSAPDQLVDASIRGGLAETFGLTSSCSAHIFGRTKEERSLVMLSPAKPATWACASMH